MSGEALRLGLDVIILFFLAITIYYTLKLSRGMSRFRQTRKEFEAIVKQLNKNIERAESALGIIKAAGENSSGEVKKILKESRDLVDELKLMNDIGNSLAKRLEKLAEQNRRPAAARAYEEPDVYDGDDLDETLYGNLERFETAQQSRAGSADRPSFMIQDRDFGESSPSDDENWNDDFAALQSQAEQELLQALKRSEKKKKPAGKSVS